MSKGSIDQSQVMIWLVVLAYMAVITGAGAYYARYMKTADAYFKAGNRIPWWAAGISMYMSNFTAYTFVAIASLVYMRGMPGLLLETGPALSFALGAVFLAHRWHRLNLTSPPEYLEARFNPATRQAYSLLGNLSRFIASGIRLLAMCKFLESVTGMPTEIMIVVTALVVIFYTVMGGLWAVIVTDVLQFVILFLAVIPMFILSVASIFIEGSWAEFVAAIPQGYASFPNTSLLAAYGGVPIEAGPQWGWLLVFWFSYFFDYNGDWGVIQRMCCTPTERDAKKAIWLSAILSLPHAFLLLGCCFVARVLWGADIADPTNVQEAELIYGRVALRLLPAGLIGIVAAAMFSATMSTLTVAWAVQSTSFVNDVWKRFLRKDASDREMILVGRVSVVVVGLVAMAVALAVAITETDIFGLAQSLISLLVTPMIVPLLFGILIPYSHRYGALMALIGTFSFGMLNKFLFQIPFEREILLSVSICLVILVGSGLLGRDEEYKQRVEAFFDRMRRPRVVEDGVVEVPSPLRVVGAFMLLIGALVLLLTLTSQPLLDRMVTLGASMVLLVIGLMMRRSPALEGKGE
jgi:SSS family transporter